MVFQVNGKVRGEADVPADESRDEEAMLAAAREHENVARYLEDSEVVKEIFVPGKLVNLVVR